MNRRYVTVLLLVLFLALGTLAAFWQALHADFTNYDDPVYVTKNPHVKDGLTREGVTWAFTQRQRSNWHPLTSISHMLDCQLYGLNPMGHHLTNLLLHIASVLLLFLALNRMTGSVWRSGFVAALFAVHPLHVESVAWVAERKDVLSTLFWMLTMGAYVLYTESPSLRRYMPVVALFALGLMAKPMLVTLPLVLLLLDWWPLRRLEITPQADSPWRTGDKRPETPWRLVWEKLPLFALAGASCVVTYVVQQKGGTMSSLDQLAPGVRAANAVVACVGYIWKMLWPRDLAVFYPHPGDSLPVWHVVGAALLLIAVSALVIRARARRPCLAMGWLWYVVTLVPVIGLVQVGLQSMADRYTYAPLIGLFVAVAWGVPEVLARGRVGRSGEESSARSRSIVLGATGGAIIAALAVLTWIQVGYWRDSTSLFRHAISAVRGNYLAHNNLGVALSEQDELEDAMAHYHEALSIRPNYPEAHNNLGFALHRRGENEDAVEHYRTAIELRPDYVRAYVNMGDALAALEELDNAAASYSEALQLDADNAEAHNGLGNVLLGQGEMDDAIEHFSEALRIDPDSVEARNNMANALLKQGDVDEAMELLSQAAEADPDSAEVHYNLGNALSAQKDYGKAIEEYSEALRVNPEYAEAHNNLGLALAAQGHLDDAIQQYVRAVEIDPGLAQAYTNWGNVLLHQEKTDEAIERFRQALGVDPTFAGAHHNLAAALYYKGRYAEAWREVKLCRKYGLDPSKRLIQMLSEKMPEPK